MKRQQNRIELVTRLDKNQPPVEDSLPELYKKLHRPPRSSALKCTGFNDANLLEYIVSAVLEVGSKGKALRLLKDESGSGMHGEATKEPKCFRVPASLELPDHLKGLANRHQFSMVPELGLMKTLQVFKALPLFGTVISCFKNNSFCG